ncbi:MAG: radical SAM protein [Myxococcaceae bacterium]
MTSSRQLQEQRQGLLADERGTLRKVASLPVALCYPSPYHVGMSSLGFQTIYREIHAHPGASAERAFLPDDAEAFRQSRTPLFTLESGTPVGAFPVLAFSVAYELELPGVLEVLTLAGLPVLAAERGADWPLVVAGGPLTFSNPEPLEPFVDVLVQGEADGLIHVLLDAVSEERDRGSLLERLARTPGFRVPGRGGATLHVTRAEDRWLPARSQIVTPHTELSSRFLLEPERGCSRGCHYCVMRRTTNGGMRTVPPDRVRELVPEHARRVGLVGAAVTDHPAIVPLLRTLVDSGREVGVSSLRADRLTAELVQTLRRGGARTLTVASDGASQRMRDLVDRRHSEEQLIRAARFAADAGMERLKVYSMVGLPLETGADVDELVRFTRELAAHLPVALGVAPFVAKRHTPLDGAPFAGIREIDDRLERLRRGLQGKAEVRPTSARWAWVEYMLAQCGPEAGLAAMDAWRSGGSFSAWKQAFAARGCTPTLRARVPDGRRNPTEWPRIDGAPARPAA